MPNETSPPGRSDPEGDRRRGRSRRGKAAEVPGDQELVLVQFKGHRKGFYHNHRRLKLAVGQYCLVEADRGRDMGRINYIGPGKAEWWQMARKQGVVQLAGAQDLARLHDNRGDEWEFWDICQEKIQARKLKMNLVTVERQFDHKKITFYFTAEKRVDFRELVRDLAGIFRTRIELRQIGVRDEARLKGGIGVCGREFCCSTFLHEFVPVTLKMAKVQALPLNPGKLSGPCGRLRCCLTYENEVYRQVRQSLPRVGSAVETPEGSGTVRKLNLLQESVSVAVPGGEGLREWPANRLWWEESRDLPSPRPRPRRRGKGDQGCRDGGCGNGPRGGKGN
ncbi:MAG: regulatory iron-sulfur-containing complex subunit RicT [Candidatus Krumholzibacteriota bacterium]